MTRCVTKLPKLRLHENVLLQVDIPQLMCLPQPKCTKMYEGRFDLIGTASNKIVWFTTYSSCLWVANHVVNAIFRFKYNSNWRSFDQIKSTVHYSVFQLTKSHRNRETSALEIIREMWQNIVNFIIYLSIFEMSRGKGKCVLITEYFLWTHAPLPLGHTFNIQYFFLLRM